MIAGIEGILEAYGTDYVIVKVGGISFQIYVPSPASTGSIGERVKLHTNLQLKENFIGIYGFATTEELELFEMVICVSGIGPKAALAMLGLVKLFRVTGLMAQVLIVGSAAPAAVNTAILSIEFKSRPEVAASTVMLTTLLCALTVTLVLVGVNALRW